MKARKAAVVGAGLNGLTTALTLRRQGFDVVVLERAERLPVRPGIIALRPYELEALRGLGLGGAVDRLAAISTHDLTKTFIYENVLRALLRAALARPPKRTAHG